MKALALGLIRLYQKTLSPDHGPFSAIRARSVCKFYPTCSAYAAAAIKKYGLLFGTAKTLGRIIRCHPWSSGGIDNP